MPQGTLEVQVIEAKKLRDTDVFGKMDPYVVLTYGSSQFKTTVKNNAGRNAMWNERFDLYVLRF